MGVTGSMAVVRARRMKEMLAQIERDKLAREVKRKEHRNEWRRQYRRKKKEEAPSPDVAVENRKMLLADRAEQKRAGKRKWRLNTSAMEEVKTLAEWTAYIFAEYHVQTAPVELEALLLDERYVFSSVSQIVEHLKDALSKKNWAAI